MADTNSLEQIPEGWKFEIKTKRNGSQVSEFDFGRKKKKAGQSSDSAYNQIVKSLDTEEGTDIQKSLDSDEGTDTEKSLDSERNTDVEELDFPADDPSENIPASEADTVLHKVQQEPRQTNSVQAPRPVRVPAPAPPASASPAGHIHRPRVRAAVLPKSFRNMKRGCPGMHPHPRFF